MRAVSLTGCWRRFSRPRNNFQLRPERTLTGRLALMGFAIVEDWVRGQAKAEYVAQSERRIDLKIVPQPYADAMGPARKMVDAVAT